MTQFRIEYENDFTSVKLNLVVTTTNKEKLKNYFEAIDTLTREFYFDADESVNHIDVQLNHPDPDRIRTIKVIRQNLGGYPNFGLKECKDLVDATSAGPVTLGPPMPRAQAISFKNELVAAGADVSIGPKKFHVMK